MSQNIIIICLTHLSLVKSVTLCFRSSLSNRIRLLELKCYLQIEIVIFLWGFNSQASISREKYFVMTLYDLCFMFQLHLDFLFWFLYLK